MYFYVYPDNNREWRWALYAANGNIIADSGEGYANKQDCVNMINVVATKTAGIPIRYKS